MSAVCLELEVRGYEIVSRATVTQHGHDIVAAKGDQLLLIEAKGAGSSKPGTARYGKEFSSVQVFDHVAKAVLKALRAAAAGDQAGIALPDNDNHRREIQQISPVLRRIGIARFWVREGFEVEVDSPWVV